MSLRDRLARYGEGVHRLGEPAYILDAELPDGVQNVYRELDGGELFHEALVLLPSTELSLEPTRIRLGEVDGDDLYVQRSDGTVWRFETDSGEWLEEGSSLDRWLSGWIDGQSVLHEPDGEYAEGVFDGAGELVPEAACRRERKILDRDKRAPAPRWRLARALTRRGLIEEARDELEEVVAGEPAFAWAWYDLARLSERLGDPAAAAEEMREAARVDPEGHAGFFLAHVARLRAAAGDEGGRAEAAAEALAIAPEAVRVHTGAARQSLDEGDREAAREHALLAAALAPRDLGVLDLLARTDRDESPQ